MGHEVAEYRRSAGPVGPPGPDGGTGVVDGVGRRARAVAAPPCRCSNISLALLDRIALALQEDIGRTDIWTAFSTSRPARSIAAARLKGIGIFALSAEIMALTTLTTSPPAKK